VRLRRRILEYRLDQAGAGLEPRPTPAELLAAEKDLAGIKFLQAENGAHQRRLAGTGFTHDTEAGAGTYRYMRHSESKMVPGSAAGWMQRFERLGKGRLVASIPTFARIL
jgi:hypothetical protein